jgi:hypothetical protein
MKLFTHIISAILITAACYLMYAHQDYHAFSTLLFSISPLLVCPPFSDQMAEWKSKYSGIEMIIQVIIAIMGFILLSIFLINLGDDFIKEIFSKLYFTGLLWLTMIITLMYSYIRAVKTQRRHLL